MVVGPEPVLPRPANPIVHLELHTGDLPAARDFYAGLCRWDPEMVLTKAGTYLALQLASGLSGGIVECGAEKPLWLPYIDVEDVDRATARAQQLGAEVKLGPREGPAGWRSVVETPAGGEVAFWQQKR